MNNIKRIELKFHIHEISVDVRISKHMFIPRKLGEDTGRVRGYMFKSREQYQRLIISAVTEYNILEFTNNGKVVFVFQYANERYSLVFAIEKKESDDFPIITVVTVEKIGSRHYNTKESFRAMRNKIYSKFILPFSSMRNIETKIGTYQNRFLVYRTFFFNNAARKYNFDENVDQERLLNSIISFFEDNIDATPTSRWLVFPRHNKFDAIRVSFERKYVKNSKKVAIIFTGYISNFDKTKVKSLGDVASLNNADTYKSFHRLEITKKRNGLTIKSKAKQ